MSHEEKIFKLKFYFKVLCRVLVEVVYYWLHVSDASTDTHQERKEGKMHKISCWVEDVNVKTSNSYSGVLQAIKLAMADRLADVASTVRPKVSIHWRSLDKAFSGHKSFICGSIEYVTNVTPAHYVSIGFRVIWEDDCNDEESTSVSL